MTASFGPSAERAWHGFALLIAVFVLLPLAALGWIAFQPTGDVWDHLISNVLPTALSTTLLMMAGVGFFAGLIGVGTAWLTTMCRFPGFRIFDWALLIPLAVPTYIVAFAYVDAFDYTGPIQTALRHVLGFKTSRDYWFPEIRSLGGTIFVMSLVLYPYVYLTSRASFLVQSASVLDVSRTLGASPLCIFFTVALPLARPAVAVGVSLVLMECLNDIGAVTFFGVRTLTFSVYETWLNRSSLGGAAQLALAMLAIVLLLLWSERRGRQSQRFHIAQGKHRSPARFHLMGWKALGAIVCCGMPILFGFLLPAALLADLASRRLDQFLSPQVQNAIVNSLWLSGITAVLTVLVAVALAYALRLRKNVLLVGCVRLASIGYAIPGAVLAVGILIPLSSLDTGLNQVSRFLFAASSGAILLGSSFGLIYAYCVRFLAISYGQVESGFAKISAHLDMASRTLGHTAGQTLVSIHLPILRPVLLSAALLTFVDCMKELPATILLRPFNFETLATTVFEAASREAFEEAALPALAIVLVGLLPVILLARTSANSFRNKEIRRRVPATDLEKGLAAKA